MTTHNDTARVSFWSGDWRDWFPFSYLYNTQLNPIHPSARLSLWSPVETAGFHKLHEETKQIIVRPSLYQSFSTAAEARQPSHWIALFSPAQQHVAKVMI